jgi:hypothetical protein
VRRWIAVLTTIVPMVQAAAQGQAAAPPTFVFHGRLVPASSNGAPVSGADATVYLWENTPELRVLIASACSAARANEMAWLSARTELAMPSGDPLDSVASRDLDLLRAITKRPHATARADANGEFAFLAIPTGDYWVEGETTAGARIVQWWHHVAYTPADFAYARLTSGLTPGRLDAEIGTPELAPVQFCPSAASIGEADERAGDSVYTRVDVEAEVVGYTRPVFPDILGNQNISGAVSVSWIVGRNGLVEPGSIRPTGPAPAEFLMAVRDAVQRWRFTPALVAGQPVRTRLSNTFHFRIVKMEPNIP